MSEKQLLITEDGSHTLYIPELDETYHSAYGAIQESNYVFITQGLDYFKRQERAKRIKIFEVGFGTGLNALLSLIYVKSHHIDISYQSIEAFPVNQRDINMLNYPDLISDELALEMFKLIHSSSWEIWNEISPGFLLKETNDLIQDFKPEERFDLCFFDAFAPSKQPEIWDKEILEEIYVGLTDRGVFVTYCAKGQLKRDLKNIGFEIETLSGPPGKMEMVRAIKI